MITLEISPDMLSVRSAPALDMNIQAEDSREKTIIQTTPDGQVLGWARQSENPKHLVRFFQGKGGFCAVVTNETLVYFGLPGSRITLPDTEVELPGEPIPGKPADLVYSLSQTPPQTVTRQAMILGAGLATRFEPVSGDTTGYPKPGVPLAGEDSVIVTIAKHLQRHGFTRLLVNTFYKPECLKTQLATISGMDVQYIDEAAPSGTAGGLLKAFQQDLVDTTQPIFIIQGDAVTDADLSFLLNTHQDRHAAVTIGGQIVPDRDVDKFGIIETDGAGTDRQSGNITSFKEKPSLAEAGPSRFANAGFYTLAPEIFPLFVETGERQLAGGKLYDYANDLFPAVLSAIGSKRIRENKTGEPMPFWAQAVGGYWSDIGNPTQYIEALRDIYAGRLQIDLPANTVDFYDNGIAYWPGAKALAIQDHALLQGNVIVARVRSTDRQ